MATAEKELLEKQKEEKEAATEGDDGSDSDDGEDGQAAGGQKKGKAKNTNTGKRGRNAKKGMIETEPTMGTRDFYPADMRIQRWLFGHWRAVAQQFAFQEYDAPILESEELYKRKAGEEITAQMYNFVAKDKTAVALRPEMTPSLARLILKQGKKMLLPVRWFAIPQCWRYENTMRGRKREHYQWNMDVCGVPGVAAEAELLAALVAFLQRVGLSERDVGVRVNSRRVLQDVLLPLGVTETLFAPVCVIVDKLDKLTPDEVTAQLTALGLSQDVIAAITRTLAIKSLAELRAVLGPDSATLRELESLFALAEAYGYGAWLQFDASVVRGLAYYTGIVFECFDRAGTLRAIAGGGRYDRLLSTYGAKQDVPCAGFGFGDIVIVELLKDKGLLPVLEPDCDDLVIAFDESLRAAACQVARKLRAQGRSVDVQLMGNKKLAWCYSYADRVGARRAVLVAPSEWAAGKVRVKELRGAPEGQKEHDVAFDTL